MKNEEQYGDVAAMRAALEYAREVLALNGFVEPVKRCDAALAAPPRNCDVGTAEEQEARYFKLKKEHIHKITVCPHMGCSYVPESLWWAQMPYEEEGGSDGK